MAELTYKSPGVGLREIDISGPSNVPPVGTPAGVIGTANRGPAFVPILIGNYQDFSNRFGPTDGEKFGPLAMYEWLRSAQAGVYLRVLGAGDGKIRTGSGINAGKVTNSGFVVGSQQIQSAGDLAANPYSLGDYDGRTFFLGCYMSESNGSTYLSEAGIQTNGTAVPILRAVLMTPSGVVASLSSSGEYSNQLPATTAPSAIVGDVTGTIRLDDASQSFVLFLSGHKASDAYGNFISASFDPKSPSYFGNLFNTDPTKIELAGHYLYSQYSVYGQYAVPTGSGVDIGAWGASDGYEDIAFCLKGSQSHNSGTVDVPNYEGFEDRFQTAFSPWVISQKFGGVPANLFKVFALDDGTYANTKVKVSIRNISPSTDPTSEFGTFDLFVRDFYDTDENPVVFESFVGLSLNPNSSRFISKAIGDMKTYYDFDREAGAQKLVVDGLYPNVSSYIRVEVDDSVINEEVPNNSLPVGFRGPWYLLTSGSLMQTAGANSSIVDLKQPPVSMRETITAGVGTGARILPYAHWGVQFEVNDSLTEPNKNNWQDETIVSHTKYFPKYHTDFKNPWQGDITAADTFNNNLFTLENVQVYTNSSDLPDSNLWTSASYNRQGISAEFGRFLKMSDLEDSTTRRFAKFSFFLQGGFDGVNIFNIDKANLTNDAAKREMDYPSTQFGPLGSTVASYRKAIDILGETSDVDIQLLAIPGLREPGVTDYAIDSVESRFDALYIMDVQERNTYDVVITGSIDTPSVNLTANAVSNRALDTSFAAVYYPDLVISDPTTLTSLVSPPSVAVLGAFAFNDRVGYPWFAPAGFSRGALTTTIEAQVKLNRTNMDTLYSANINPIATVPNETSPVIFGQKTLLARASALDRVNVRRLLIEIRRRVKTVANTILFEPNRDTTLARFSSLVDPILKQIQSQSGIERYRVQIDTSTTTQADVENNTIRGKIFVQPTKTIEFVSLDFVVTNAGAQI